MKGKSKFRKHYIFHFYLLFSYFYCILFNCTIFLFLYLLIFIEILFHFNFAYSWFEAKSYSSQGLLLTLLWNHTSKTQGIIRDYGNIILLTGRRQEHYHCIISPASGIFILKNIYLENLVTLNFCSGQETIMP